MSFNKCHIQFTGRQPNVLHQIESIDCRIMQFAISNTSDGVLLYSSPFPIRSARVPTDNEYLKNSLFPVVESFWSDVWRDSDV